MELLNLKPEAIAFIDDNPFERDAVQYQHPKVRVYEETAVPALLSYPEFTPRFITPGFGGAAAYVSDRSDAAGGEKILYRQQ